MNGLIHRKRHKVEPQEPPRTLASIEAILGDNADLVECYIDALFEASLPNYVEQPNTIVRAGVILAWKYQRMVKQRVRPWKRSWRWQPEDRERIGAEIVGKVLLAPDFAEIVRIRIENHVYAAFDLVGPSFVNFEAYDSRLIDFERYMEANMIYVELKKKNVCSYNFMRSCLLLYTCYVVGGLLLVDGN